MTDTSHYSVPLRELLSPFLKAAAEHHRAGRLDTAAALYEKILDVDPCHPDALVLLGVLERERGHHREARQRLEEASQWAANRARITAKLLLVEVMLDRHGVPAIHKQKAAETIEEWTPEAAGKPATASGMA